MTINTSSELRNNAPQSTPQLGASHIGYLDGLRALAALFVLVHHVWLTAYYNIFPRPDLDHPAAPTALYSCTRFLGLGHFAVDLFIVLSGYCLTLPTMRSDGTLIGGALQFYKRRARRILPPYYAALGLSLLLIFTLVRHHTGDFWDMSIPITTLGLATHLLLLQNFFDAPQINYVLWTIAVEWQIYFFFPLLLASWKKFGVAPTVIATVVACLVANAGFAQLHTWPLSAILGAHVELYSLFVFGMTAASIAHSTRGPAAALRARINWKATVLFICGIAILLVAGRLLKIIGSHAWVADYIVGACAAWLLVVATLDARSAITRVCSWRPLVLIGTFAYSLYLIHAPLIQVLWQYVVKPLPLSMDARFIVLIVLAPVLIVPASYVFYLLCEKPFLRKRKRETQSELERDATLSPAP